MISIEPIIISGQILKLPETKRHKRNKAKPNTLINGIEPNPRSKGLLTESSDGGELVDESVLQQRNNQSPQNVKDYQCEVMAGGDKEGCRLYC